MNQKSKRIARIMTLTTLVAMAHPIMAQPKPDAELAALKAYEVDGKRAEWMKGQWGVMTHYLLAWQSREHNLPMTAEQWNKMVDAFDAEGLAGQIKSAGARYHILTLGQGTTHLIAPSPLFVELFGNGTNNCARRDLVADMAAADAKHGIRLIVYATTGPFGGSRQFGSTNGNPAGDYRNKERMLAWERVLREWSLRWGDKVSGWWLDGCYTPNRTHQYPDAPNFQSEAAALRAGNPMAAVTFNRGVMDRPISITPYEDYNGGEINDLQTVRPWRVDEEGKVDGARMHFLSYLGEKWGIGAPRYENLGDIVIPYTLRLVEMGGAVTWDTPVQPNGLIEDRFLGQLRTIGKAVADAPKGTLEELTAGRAKATARDFMVIVAALGKFQQDLGRYPSTEEGLDALVRKPPGAAANQWKGPYLKEIPKDAFGARFRYLSPGKRNPKFDLVSSGPDLEFGTRDDLTAEMK